MKRFMLPAILFAALLLAEMEANAQRGRIYRGHPVYRSRTMVSVGIGGMWGGFYGPRVWGYGWGPGVGVNIGVVVPPPGATVRSIPQGAVKVEINGIIYYRKGDTYFRERQDGAFEIVATPLGGEVSRLPAGAKLQKIDGKYYYEKNGTYYYKDVDADGRPVYLIAGRNGELNTQENDYSAPYENYNSADDTPEIVNEDSDAKPVTDKNDAYTVRPQVGDRLEQLPRNSKQVTVNGKKLFVSPNNVYYKEISEDGQTVYEVVEGK